MSPTTSGVTRLAGQSRVDTALAIAQAEYSGKVANVILATADNYPDALSISSVAAQMQLPILLVQNDGLSDSVSQEIAAIKPTKVYVIGGEGVISTAMESQVAQLTGLPQGNIVRIGGADRYATSLAVAQFFAITSRMPWQEASMRPTTMPRLF